MIFNKEYENYFPRYRPSSSKERPKCFLVFGDEKGFVKQWDLSVFVHDS